MDEVDRVRGSSLKRRRAPKGLGETGESAVEEQKVDKRFRRAGAHLNFQTNREILKHHGQWREKEMQLFLNTGRGNDDVTVFEYGVGEICNVVATAKAADECNRILGQELPQEEERLYAKDVLAAKTRELDARTQFKVYNPLEPGKGTEEVVGTRWVLTWKMVEGAKTAKARLVAKGYQGPDFKQGLVETSGSASLRPPHLQVVSLAALRGWRLRSIDIKNARPQADGFGREVFTQSPPEWLRGESRRIWKLNAPAYGLDDAPAARHRSLKRY